MKYALCNCKFSSEKLKSIQMRMCKRINCDAERNRSDNEIEDLIEKFCAKYDITGHMEKCPLCSVRDKQNHLMLESMDLQKDLKKDKFKKYRKNPIQNDNILFKFLYNICYEGINQIHYPVYLVNRVISQICDAKFHKTIKNYSLVTDDNKIAKRTIYTISSFGYEMDPNYQPKDFKGISCYSFQYPHTKPKNLIDYEVEGFHIYKTKYLYGAFYQDGNCYLYRMRVERSFIFKKGQLPFKDIYTLIFYDDKIIRKLFQENDLLLELKIQVINVEKEGEKYVKKLNYSSLKKEKHKLLFTRNN